MAAVLGASLGVSGIRAVSQTLDRQNSPDPRLPSTTHFERIAESADDPWGSVTWAVHRLAREHQADATTPVLALRQKNPTEAYGVEQSEGLALVTDLGAQLGALYEAGEIASERVVALFDVGAGGVTVSIVDRETGRIHASRRSAVLSGDGCDALLSDFLFDGSGRGQLTPDARDLMVEVVCAAKERLSAVTAVEVHGPFTSGTVVLHRSQLDDLIRESVYDAVTLTAAMLDDGPRVDALYAVGGGANMQIVRQSLLDALSVPVFVPREPELLAARGALGIARGNAAASALAGPAPRPRHSDPSSRRLTRLRRSRYLGGAVVALVAGGVAVTIAAASSRQEVVPPSVDYVPVITSIEAGVVTTAPAVTMTPTSDPGSADVTTPAEPVPSDAAAPRSTSATSTDTTTSAQRRQQTPSTTSSTPPTTTESRTRDSQPATAAPTRPATPTTAASTTTKATTKAAPVTTTKAQRAVTVPTEVFVPRRHR